MIQVIDSKVLENCSDRSVVKELELSEAVGELIMKRIARRGKLQYFPNFPRAYFRVDRNRFYVVQGVFGNTTLRVTFSPGRDVDAQKQLEALIETPRSDESGS